MKKATFVDGSESPLQKYGAMAFFVLLLVFNMIFTRNFLDVNTLWNAVVQSTTVLLLSLGMMLVIATGGIDVSLGAVVAFSSTMMVLLLDAGLGAVAVVIAVVLAGAVGAFSGFVISRFKIQPLIVTLALMTSVRGIAQLASNGALLPLKSPQIQQLAYYRVGDAIPIQLFIIVGAVIVFYLLAKKTRFGLYVEAYGDNAKATELVGIKTGLLLVGVYMIGGLMAGFGGVIETARISAADSSNIGMNMEMDAIAAVAIGGTPMNGGKIHIGGTIMGVFLMQTVTMMVNMNNIPYEASLILKAAIIIFAVYIQTAKKCSKKKSAVIQHG